MRLPFLMISFGNFAETKRLFFYEKNGTCMLPIFDNTETSAKFLYDITDRMRELGDERKLCLQACDDINKAIEMFSVIMTYMTDLKYVIINPDLDLDVEPMSILDFYKLLQSESRKDSTVSVDS